MHHFLFENVKFGLVRVSTYFAVIGVIALFFPMTAYRAFAVLIVILYFLNFILCHSALPAFLVFHEVFVLTPELKQKNLRAGKNRSELNFEPSGCTKVVLKVINSNNSALVKLRWVVIFILVVFFLLVVGLIADKGLTISLPGDFSPFKDSDEYSEIETRFQDSFTNLDNSLDSSKHLTFYWGTREVVKDSSEKFDISHLGSIVMEDLFELSSASSQYSLVNFCT